ncbi:MAG: hypothetical protein DID90_2727554847 [Candidatus Nitrotoga sp. LAW]|nr:MAG: hypothetical protein DID90_2727554847 [Candidatus Nitrotoga sp. LAW]
MGTVPALMRALLFPPLRWIGAATKVASIDLAAFEFNTHLSKCLVQAIKQDLSEFVLFEGFTKGLYGTRIGGIACQFNSQKSHERQAVRDLVLSRSSDNPYRFAG